MTEPETEYLDTADVVSDLVDTWCRLIVAAFRQRYGREAGRDLQQQVDLLRTTIWDALEQSYRVVVKDAQVTSVDGIPTSLIHEVNSIEGEQE